MSKSSKYKVDYKNKCVIKGTVLFGDYPQPDAEYPDTIGLTLIITEAQKLKFEEFARGAVKSWLSETGKKKFTGLKAVPSKDKDGNEDGNYKINLKRKTEINGNLQTIPTVDKVGNKLELDGNITRGSVVQVQLYLYLSHNGKECFGRAEPNAVRVLELAERVTVDADWGDDDDDEDTPDVSTEASPDWDSEDDDEDMC